MAQGLFCLLFIVMSVITGFDWAEMILISFVLPAVISQTLMIQKTIEELRLELWKKLDVKKDYTLLADKQRYVNHTYLKKFDAFGFTYDSESEQKHLFSSINQPVENEYILTSNNEFIPGVTLRRR